jgi:hypothetical protein
LRGSAVRWRGGGDGGCGLGGSIWRWIRGIYAPVEPNAQWLRSTQNWRRPRLGFKLNVQSSLGFVASTGCITSEVNPTPVRSSRGESDSSSFVCLARSCVFNCLDVQRKETTRPFFLRENVALYSFESIHTQSLPNTIWSSIRYHT